jgi:subtilisin family serine protease
MKQRILSGIAVCLVILLCSLTPGLAQVKVTAWSDIPSSHIGSDGRVRVMVVFDVPDLATLTQDSIAAPSATGPKNSLKSGNPPAATADTTLNQAIAAGADEVLGRITPTLRSSGGSYTLSRRYDILPVLALSVSRNVLETLVGDPQVTAVYLDEPMSREDILGDVPGTLAADDPAEPLTTEDVMALIGADAAWTKGHTGAGWYVAILDTGILTTHEMFAGKDIVEACFSYTASCPNGTETMVGPGAAEHFEKDYYGYDHGTHVAGSAAGASPSYPIHGVAKDANIIAVNVFSKLEPSENCQYCDTAYDSDILAGLIYIYTLRNTYNIGAVNMSLGGGRYTEFCDDAENFPAFMAITLLKEVNIPTVISSGNSTFCGATGAPGCISSAITVMASTRTDMEVKFNNWSSTIGDIFAPGQKIMSAVGSGDTDYEAWSGTSMAAPHVAGAMTLMRQARPATPTDELLARLTALGPWIQTPCSDNGSKPRLYVDNFDLNDMEKAEVLFTQLEAAYPALLQPQPGVSQEQNGYIYRYYSGTNAYIATHEGHAFYLDPDGTLMDLGPLDDLLD